MSNVNGKTVRNLALDFTKGVLVLFMVLYHWINYFISTEGYVYRYLRFITPSFIFITGFLITQAYLAKYDVHDPRLPKRLLQRGIKILVMFTLLNLGASLVSPKSHEGSSFGFSSLPAYLVSLYVPEAGRAATFQVLVPIGCLLILCSGLLLMRRWFDYSIYATCAILFAGIFVADVCGWVNGTLELVGIGLLGVYLGNIPTATINRLLPYSPAVLLAYGAYLAAVSIWDVIYPLQVVGVCLSLLLIYLAGTICRSEGFVETRILMLGRYSLLAYIAQIVVLQLLVRLLHAVQVQGWKLTISFLGALLLTQFAVEIVEWGRTRSKTADGLYRTMFA